MENQHIDDVQKEPKEGENESNDCFTVFKIPNGCTFKPSEGKEAIFREEFEETSEQMTRNVSEYRIRVLDLPVFNTGKSVVIEVTDNKNCKGNASF